MSENINKIPNSQEGGVDPEIAEIVTKIQELQGELKQLEDDKQFPTAVKERLMKDINAEISALNTQKMDTIAERAAKGEEKSESDDDIDPFAHEGKQRIGPRLS